MMQITKQQLLDLKPCSIPNVPDVITLDWALENVTTKQLLWVISKLGYRKELILFAIFCARQNEHLLSHNYIYAINVIERFAYGMARQNEIILARKNVYVYVYAYADAARAYAAAAAAYAADAAADAYAAAYDYAADAAAAAAAYAAKKDQLNYLRSLFI